MPRINCSVRSCYYNQEKICGAHVLNIGGIGAQITEATCCETYQEQSEFSNLAHEEVSKGETDVILCEVNTCAYHAKRHCTLQEIEVGSLKEAEHYSETDCLSFERK
ncbi:DUF1540 domain-containing protein [Cellulosilyticum sp. I15G10I2]|uniref:DUF1540 domain-containing protein n=1 Tax=Cellulosilyticum sp. I15G10I2 TaxID=1892843 RepID=UPI00085C2CB9|nr:DUF1540 domain-containing protein [Cellulosilyticum sp. I15G10I2]